MNDIEDITRYLKFCQAVNELVRTLNHAEAAQRALKGIEMDRYAGQYLSTSELIAHSKAVLSDLTNSRCEECGRKIMEQGVNPCDCWGKKGVIR